MTDALGQVADHSDLARIEVLPGRSAADYLADCRVQHPELYGMLNPARVPIGDVARLYAGIAEQSTHFESKLEGGRGDAYREAQNTHYLNRSVAFLNLFDLLFPDRLAVTPACRLLDALGGNGTLTRILRDCLPSHGVPFTVTSDVSGRMVESALAQGLPAVRFPLQDLIWFDDCTFDAVFAAYGTHHIPRGERHRAVAEAYRVVKPGGRILLQDFEIGAPTTAWYADVLDRYTLTGHKYDYFTRQDLHDLLAENAFVDIEVKSVYDPLIYFAESADEAKRGLLTYVFTLFALEKLVPPSGEPTAHFWDSLERVIRDTSTFAAHQLPPEANGVAEFAIAREGNRYRAEIPRVCLAATGRRPPEPASATC